MVSRLPPLVYLALALIVAGPLLAPGYVFALDHAMGPQSASYESAYVAHNSDAIQSKGGYAILLRVLSFLGPMWIGQKLVLFAPVFLAGWGAHRLARTRASLAAAYFAGLLYALSPFAYLRGVAGQTGVLWAYALAPWALAAWLRYVDTRQRRALAACVLLVAATIVFQAHGAVILALLFGVHTIVRVVRAPREWISAVRPALALAGWTLVVNAYWLVPVLLAPETTLTRIGEGDRAFFATTSAGLPSVGLAALTLQGFWRGGYAQPYAFGALLVVPAAILVLSIRGLVKRADDAAVGVAAAGALGLALAVGTSSPLTSWLVDALWDHVPLMRGFRDAHKFLALLALAYAFLAPVGLDALRADAETRKRGSRNDPRDPRLRVLGGLGLALIIAMPIAGATPLLWGYGGQLGAVEYPKEWADVEARTAGCDGAMAVLPWHLYMDASWLPNADKRVTLPAKVYFSCPVIGSDDIELGAAASQPSTPVAGYVDHWMRKLGATHALGDLLSPARVRYVLLLKESDWRADQKALDAQGDLKLVVDNARVRLYENLAPIEPALHQADRVERIATLDDLLAKSGNASIARSAFVLGNGVVPNGTLAVFAPGPRVPATAWTLAGKSASFQSLGFAPAFEAPAEGRVRDTFASRTAAVGWGISILAACALIAISIRARGDRGP